MGHWTRITFLVCTCICASDWLLRHSIQARALVSSDWRQLRSSPADQLACWQAGSSAFPHYSFFLCSLPSSSFRWPLYGRGCVDERRNQNIKKKCWNNNMYIHMEALLSCVRDFVTFGSIYWFRFKQEI